MSTRDRFAANRPQRQHAVAQPQAHEMSNLGVYPPTTGHERVNAPNFLTEVTSIQSSIEEININVANISALHGRTLSVMESDRNQDAARLDDLTAATRNIISDTKDRIKTLERESITVDAQMRRNTAALVRTKFIEAIQNYQRVEQEHRLKSRARVERQLKIVKPDATAEEVAAVADGGGQQIFAEALTSSSRYGESRTAYREVQERQQDLKKMEQTLAELAQLFIDMGTLVDQQEEMIDSVESTAKDVEADAGKAVNHIGKALVHARSYRKGRWICFFIFLGIAAVLAIVLGVVLGGKKG